MNKLVLLNLIFNFLSRILSGNNRVLLFLQLKLKKVCIATLGEYKEGYSRKRLCHKEVNNFQAQEPQGNICFSSEAPSYWKIFKHKRHDTIIRHCSPPPPLFSPFTAKLKWWPKGKSDCKFFRIFLCSLRSKRFRASSSRKLAD